MHATTHMQDNFDCPSDLDPEDDGPLPTPLPRAASTWNQRKLLLWKHSKGAFDPSTGCEKSISGRVSVVTPTTEARSRFHASLYACFQQQTWPDKELVVVETYTSKPSDFFTRLAKQDDRVVFYSVQRPEGADWSIGLKRNIGTHVATGEFLANFDDDDLYAPKYLWTMVEELRAKRVKGLTLSSWFIFDTETSTYGYCNPIEWGNITNYHHTHPRVREAVYGYGFSYVYRREVALAHQYPDQGMGEDYKFFSELQKTYGDRCIGLFEDKIGLCLHTLHGKNTSDSIALWEVNREEVKDLDVAECEGFATYAFQFKRKEEKQNKHIMNWQDRGRHLRMGPQFKYRNITAHTPVGKHCIECRRGAVKRDFIEALEEQMGALPLSTVVFRTIAGADEIVALQENERIGCYTAELWLAFPEENASESGTSKRANSAVHVTIPMARAKTSSSRVFHIDLELKSTVADLRALLVPMGLPEQAEVFAFLPKKGRKSLGNNDRVPPKVFLSDFTSSVKMDMVLTPAQARDIQHLLIDALESSPLQEQLDQLEAKAAGDRQKYIRMLNNMLSYKVYPNFLKHFGLPQDDRGPTLMFQAIAPHCQNWYGQLATYFVELLRRNWPVIHFYWSDPSYWWLRAEVKIEAHTFFPPNAAEVRRQYAEIKALLAAARDNPEKRDAVVLGTGPPPSAAKKMTASMAEQGNVHAVNAVVSDPDPTPSALSQAEEAQRKEGEVRMKAREEAEAKMKADEDAEARMIAKQEQDAQTRKKKAREESEAAAREVEARMLAQGYAEAQAKKERVKKEAEAAAKAAETRKKAKEEEEAKAKAAQKMRETGGDYFSLIGVR